MEKQKIKKILICSLGSIGKRHIKIIKDFDPYIKIGILRSYKQIKSFKDVLADFITFDINDAINWSPDAAIVCSPASLHLNQSLILAKNEIPLLIEKPLGTGNENQYNFLELSQISKKLPILCGYNLRHNNHILFLKDQLHKRKLGKIIDVDFYCGSWLPDWRYPQPYETTVSASKKLGGGVILELSHEIDLANFLFGPLEIYAAYSKNSNILNIDVEDHTVIVAKNKENILITIRLNFCTSPRKRIIDIRGVEGEIKIDLENNKLTIDTKNGGHITKLNDQSRDDLFKKQFLNFLNCISKTEFPMCSFSEGLEVLSLIKEIKKLSKNN